MAWFQEITNSLYPLDDLYSSEFNTCNDMKRIYDNAQLQVKDFFSAEFVNHTL